MTNELNPSNLYYLAYTILSTALKNTNIYEGIEQSLYYTKMCFNAKDVIVYKKDSNGDYNHKFNQPLMEGSSNIVTAFLNNAKKLIESNKYYQINLEFTDFKNILFIPIILEDTKYVVTLISNNQFKNFNEPFLDLFSESMHIILDRLEMIKGLTKIAEIDSLTGLNNRIAYDKKIFDIGNSENLVYGLLDLFRLKRINDNYSHEIGDQYIKKSASILKKIFPKYLYTVDSNGKKGKVETGTSIYRIGGDEFALISNSESYDDILIKMLVVSEEIKNLDLGIDEFFRINYGIVARENDNSFRDLYLKADKKLSDHKREMYKVLGLDRRR